MLAADGVDTLAEEARVEVRTLAHHGCNLCGGEIMEIKGEHYLNKG